MLGGGLGKNKPAAVAVDVIFAEPSRISAGDDSKLASALQLASYPVIFPVEQTPTGLLKPLGLFKDKVLLGHVNLTLDKDGVVRRFPLKLLDYNSFAYESIKSSGMIIPNEQKLQDINRIVFAEIRKIDYIQVQYRLKTGIDKSVVQNA